MPIVLESFFNPAHKKQVDTHIKIKEVDAIVEVVIGSVQWKWNLNMMKWICLKKYIYYYEVGKRVKDDIN